ncbi:MAG: hypothetical protein A2444_00080 [Candidatus Staskawiczbacteria bacterium RIFOXYC2_FULL_37_19]|nr:MAG: hypothetical protein A2444_00080 [Candidatus Staskawiczbacteria bacterium RIFOXYC2_FULL_37_19]
MILTVTGVFVFHWFLVGDMMPVSECVSIECVYSSAQILPPETINTLLVVLIAVLLAVIMPLTIPLDNKLRRISGRMFLKWKFDVFLYKFISWLKILEKRDPQTASIAARI